ncbi:hypothetical protein KAR91_66345 [Candidatus Pacearchaeota archaeon]|nr:hypothetical protein [Candidatus Pacearchaeota archaeon]
MTDDEKLTKILERVVELQTNEAGKLDTHEKRLGKIDTNVARNETKLNNIKERLTIIDTDLKALPEKLEVKFTLNVQRAKGEIETLFNEKINQIKSEQITLPKLLIYIGITAGIISCIVTVITMFAKVKFLG